MKRIELVGERSALCAPTVQAASQACHKASTWHHKETFSVSSDDRIASIQAYALWCFAPDVWTRIQAQEP